MNMAENAWFGEILLSSKKMRPLTLALVQAAIEQGANIQEFSDACATATALFREHLDKLALRDLEGNVETTLDGIRESLDALVG